MKSGRSVPISVLAAMVPVMLLKAATSPVGEETTVSVVPRPSTYEASTRRLEPTTASVTV
ncbi:hypothetical protein FQZ97_1092400 [compost metagenome]